MELTVIKFVFIAALGTPSLLMVVITTIGRITKFLLRYQFALSSGDRLSGGRKGKLIFSNFIPPIRLQISLFANLL